MAPCAWAAEHFDGGGDGDGGAGAVVALVLGTHLEHALQKSVDLAVVVVESEEAWVDCTCTGHSSAAVDADLLVHTDHHFEVQDDFLHVLYQDSSVCRIYVLISLALLP